jgi:hemolysin activation/secretion protein
MNVSARTAMMLVLGLGIGLGPVRSSAGAAGPALPAAGPPSAAAPAAPSPAAKSETATAPPQHLDILEYDVAGNTVLPELEIEKAVYPFLGPGRTTEDVDRARAALEQAYHKRGYNYVQVQIPTQKAEDGIVRLTVIENRIEQLRVVGAQYSLPSAIKQEAPSLAEGTVPNLKAVQNDLVTLNQLPGRQIKPDLRPGREPGTLIADLTVDEEPPFHATVELNNRKSQSTDELRTIGTFSVDNLWQLGHSLSFSYQTAPQNTADAEAFSASYLVRFPGRPYSLQLTGVKNDSTVATFGAGTVLGIGESAGLHGILSLPGSETLTHTLTAGITYKNFIENTTVTGQTPVSYYPFDISYSAVVQEEKAVDQATATVNFAYPRFGSTTGQFNNKRFEGNPQYAYLRADLSREQTLPFGGSAFFRAAGQASSQPLISNEQFAAGGADTVRGYLEAEQLGDDAVLGSFELRSPSLAGALNEEFDGKTFDDFHLLAFVEGAALWIRRPLPGEIPATGLASAGFGSRFKLLGHFNGAVDAAFPLDRGVVTRQGAWRTLFRVWSEY